MNVGNWPVAYTYKVVPDNPDWTDVTPAFEPFHSVTFDHPYERFEDMDGVKAIGITPLYRND